MARESAFLRNADGDRDALKPGIYTFKALSVIEAWRVIITLQDERLPIDGYGNGPPLESGINFFLCRAGGTFDSLLEHDPFGRAPEEVRIHTSFEWAEHCYDETDKGGRRFFCRDGRPVEVAWFRFTFSKAGAPIIMAPGDMLELEIPPPGLEHMEKNRFNHQYNTLTPTPPP